MEITQIQRQQKHKDRYSLYVDQQFYCGVSENTLIHFALHKGMAVTEVFLAEVQEVEQRERLYTKAIGYLSHAIHSVAEVRRYLVEFSLKETTFELGQEKADYLDQLSPYIEAVLTRLIAQGYLDDLAYGESYVRTEAIVSRKGPNVIRHRLTQKGLSAADVTKAIAVYPVEQLEANLHYLITKYCRSHANLPSKRLKIKLQQYLVSRGYDRESIEAALDAQLDQIDVETETQLVSQAADKALRSLRRRYQGYALRQKMKEKLLRQGFEYSMIQQWLEEHDVLADEE